MHHFPLFVGYPRLESWAKVADHARPVYATPCSQAVGRDTGGPLLYDLLIVVAQADSDGVVQYCRMKAACVTLLDGQPFGSDAPVRYKAQGDLWALVRAWLLEQGFTLREAAFDTPKDLIHFNGRAGFVTWDPEAKRYVRADCDTAEGGER